MRDSDQVLLKTELIWQASLEMVFLSVYPDATLRPKDPLSRAVLSMR